MLNELLKKRFLTVLIVVVIIVSLIAGIGRIFPGKDGKRANFVADAVGIIVSPFQGAFSWAVGNICDVVNFFGSSKWKSEEIERLNKEIAALENNLSELDAYKEQNDTLRNLLEIQKQNIEYDPVCAEVIGREAENWSGLIKLNKGTLSGIAKKDVVISNDGLVGYVSEVGTNWCVVTTIVSPDSGISCVIPRTGEIVILDGEVKDSGSNKCKLSYIAADSLIAQGEAVETSGEGGIYPQGFFVGRVDNIYNAKDGISKEADVKTAVDFRRLRDVLVFRKK